MSITVNNSFSGGRTTTDEIRRPLRHPISRWYACEIADRLASALCHTRVRPVHLTICGLLATCCAAGVLVYLPTATPLAAVLVLTAWLFDRADGQLARRQQTTSAFGAWLDANIDELSDVVMHVSVAFAAAGLLDSTWPWAWLIAFLAGKYLLMVGLNLEEQSSTERTQSNDNAEHAGWLRRLYHLPGNADVRTHLLIVSLLTGYLTVELATIAIYYNVRWIARYALVARRLGGVR